jgi:hypothetical protein
MTAGSSKAQHEVAEVPLRPARPLPIWHVRHRSLQDVPKVITLLDDCKGVGHSTTHALGT